MSVHVHSYLALLPLLPLSLFSLSLFSQTGLISLANTVVGSSIGPGLSGGQKRRLCVALQLLSMPSLIFLDEPTSGEKDKEDSTCCALQ